MNDPAAEPPLALTLDAAAETSTLSKSTLRRAMASGELAHVQIGTRKLILTGDLAMFLVRHRLDA